MRASLPPSAITSAPDPQLAQRPGPTCRACRRPRVSLGPRRPRASCASRRLCASVQGSIWRGLAGCRREAASGVSKAGREDTPPPLGPPGTPRGARSASPGVAVTAAPAPGRASRSASHRARRRRGPRAAAGSSDGGPRAGGGSGGGSSGGSVLSRAGADRLWARAPPPTAFMCRRPRPSELPRAAVGETIGPRPAGGAQAAARAPRGHRDRSAATAFRETAEPEEARGTVPPTPKPWDGPGRSLREQGGGRGRGLGGRFGHARDAGAERGRGERARLIGRAFRASGKRAPEGVAPGRGVPVP